MLDTILAKVFGTKNEREIKALRPIISAIGDLEPQMQQLSDTELAQKTQEFKQRLANGETLDDILIEAFAVCREAGRRVLNMRHFDVQLIGGIVLHRGKIAEMKTGEGKTLVATLAVYLNALAGNGVHVITVNDYLAHRDSEWMGRIYKFLGLTVGVIVHDLDDEERKAAYNCDITYGTNNEFGFDYLRDNMKFRIADCVQRGHHFAIVDEVDSILIDEARTPLIISGPSEESTDKYFKINRIIPKLIRGEVIEGKEPGEKYTTGDYTVDEKHRSAALTEEGVLKVEKLLGIGNLYDAVNIEINHHVQQALKAHVIFHRDTDYLVQDGQVVIVDEFTGRIMPGRRWSDGLHQAVEAKEGVKIERENQTLATITFQNYFRMFKKLAGMTGTAETEAAEFEKIYKLDVVVIPTNRAMSRKENQDVVYRTEEEKFRNAAKEIKEFHDRGQPVLVGTVSVEKSEKLSGILKSMGVRHEVLNAKNHEREAFIVAQAGRKNQVTVSTNMAGRGTDILLGGNPEFMAKEEFRKRNLDPDAMQTAAHGTPERAEWDAVFQKYKAETDVEHDEVVAAGGLHVLGTERHESRRIDNQLRGRAGRQGDPGSSRFYLSLQDDLMRIFGGERMQNLMLRLGMEEDVPIESKMITKRIAAAQKAVEAQNFASRKHLLEYDDVMNKQRQAVYGLRSQLLSGADQRERIMDIVRGIVAAFIDTRCPEKEHPTSWDFTGLQSDVLTQFGVKINPTELSQMNRAEIEEAIVEQLENRYKEKEEAGWARDDARCRAHDHAQRHRQPVEGPPLVDGPLKGRHRTSRLRPERSSDRVQEGVLRLIPGHDGPDRRRVHPLPVLPADLDRSGNRGDGDGNGSGISRPRPVLPFDPEEDEFDDEDEEEEPVAVPDDKRREAQLSVQDFTKNIHRKKDKEMAELNFVGGAAAGAQKKQAISTKKAGRNDPCPCGSGKKYKKCCGAS